jgi:putative iron-dependent peroxidase
MSTTFCQPAILGPVPDFARFISFRLREGHRPRAALQRIAEAAHDPKVVIGIGSPVFENLAATVSGVRAFPVDMAQFPSTQGALWLLLTHGDRSAIFDSGCAFAALLEDAFEVIEEIDAFKYRGGRDLTGFEDGTENPKNEAAVAAAIVAGRGNGLDGGSFVAVQRWVHDLRAVQAMSQATREDVIGRRQESNEELPDAPPSAHVKRTAQESFEPEAFVLRRSMPYGGIAEHGLYFVAYGESLDRFERQLRRMSGRDDGILDGLLSFTRAVTGSYYFCPPLSDGKLDLRALRL